MILDGAFALWAQLAIAVIGLLIGVLCLVEALLDFRLLRAMGLNAARKILTRSDVFDEFSRCVVHGVIIWATLMRIFDTKTMVFTWYNRLALAVITVLVASSSYNSFRMRRDVLRSIADEHQLTAADAAARVEPVDPAVVPAVLVLPQATVTIPAIPGVPSKTIPVDLKDAVDQLKDKP